METDPPPATTAPPHDSSPPVTTTRNIAKPRSNRNQRRSSNNNTPSTEKRNKANKACKGCRKKKVKCEGEVPCERCQKAGLECVFDTVAPAKRTSSSRRTTNNTSSQPPTRSNSQDDITDASRQQQQQKEESGFFTSIPAPADGISVSTTGRGLYIPDWLSRGSTKRSGDDEEGIENEYNSLDQDRNMFAKPSDIHHDLLSTYFEHIHPYLPIIHRPTFQKQLQENKICELLLYAMYAVASRWNNNNKHLRMSKNNMQSPAGWTYYESAFKLLDNYADAPRLSTVQALILMIKYHEHVRRPGFFWRTRFYFQLIVRMCQDLELYRHPHHYQRNASVMTNAGDQPRTADTEQRSRVFWAVYVYDVLTSTEQGTVANFTNSSVDFPQQLPEEDGVERDIIKYFHWSAKIAHIHGKILTFLRSKYGQSGTEDQYEGGIMSDEEEDSPIGGRGGNGATSKRLNQVWTLTTTQERKQRDILVSNIEELRKTMFTAIRQPSSADGKSSSSKQYPYYASRFLYMSLHFAAILLHRPYGEISMHHREQCSIAALAITQIANELIQTGGVECLYYCPRGVQQAIHYLAASITIHRLLASSPPSLISSSATKKAQQQQQQKDAVMEKKAKEACEKSLEIIHQLIKVSPAVEIYADRQQHQQNNNNNNNSTNSDEDEPATPPSPSPTPMEEVPISPPDRTTKARRVSKEFSGIRQNSGGGLISGKMEGNHIHHVNATNNTNVNNNNTAGLAMPPPPQPQPQQNTVMNTATTPIINSTPLIQQHSPFPQSAHHPNPNRFSAPNMMFDYASSLYLQQQQQAQAQTQQQQTPQPSPVSQYPTLHQQAHQQTTAQYATPNFSQASVSVATNFYSQALVHQQQAQQFLTQQQQQSNHHITQPSNVYQQHHHQHHLHPHHHTHSHSHHHTHPSHHHQQQLQQNPSTRRHTVSGDINTMANFMMYPGMTAAGTTTATAIVSGIGDVTSSGMTNNNNGTSIAMTNATSAAATAMNTTLWPSTSFIDQDISMDPYTIQPSVAQSMMGLLMDQDENSMFAATAAAPAPP